MNPCGAIENTVDLLWAGEIVLLFVGICIGFGLCSYFTTRRPGLVVVKRRNGETFVTTEDEIFPQRKTKGKSS